MTPTLALSAKQSTTAARARHGQVRSRTVVQLIDHGGRYAYGTSRDRAVEPRPTCRSHAAAVRSGADRAWRVPPLRSTVSRACSSSTGSTACEESLTVHAGSGRQRSPRLARVDAAAVADFTNTFRSMGSGRPAGDSTSTDPELEAWQSPVGARRRAAKAVARRAEDLSDSTTRVHSAQSQRREGAPAATGVDDYS